MADTEMPDADAAAKPSKWDAYNWGKFKTGDAFEDLNVKEDQRPDFFKILEQEIKDRGFVDKPLPTNKNDRINIAREVWPRLEELCDADPPEDWCMKATNAFLGYARTQRLSRRGKKKKRPVEDADTESTDDAVKKRKHTQPTKQDPTDPDPANPGTFNRSASGLPRSARTTPIFTTPTAAPPVRGPVLSKSSLALRIYKAEDSYSVEFEFEGADLPDLMQGNQLAYHLLLDQLKDYNVDQGWDQRTMYLGPGPKQHTAIKSQAVLNSVVNAMETGPLFFTATPLPERKRDVKQEAPVDQGGPLHPDAIPGDSNDAEAKRLKEEADAEAKRREADAEAERLKEEADAEAKRREADAEAERLKEEADAEAKRREADAEAKRKEADAEAKRREADAEAKRKEADAEAKRQEEEAAAAVAKSQQDEAAKKQRENEAAKKQREDEAAAKKKQLEDEAAKKQREDEAAAKKQQEQDEAAAKKQREDEAAKKQREDEAAKKQREDEAAKKQREDEAAASKQLEDEATAAGAEKKELWDRFKNQVVGSIPGNRWGSQEGADKSEADKSEADKSEEEEPQSPHGKGGSGSGSDKERPHRAGKHKFRNPRGSPRGHSDARNPNLSTPNRLRSRQGKPLRSPSPLVAPLGSREFSPDREAAAADAAALFGDAAGLSDNQLPDMGDPMDAEQAEMDAQQAAAQYLFRSKKVSRAWHLSQKQGLKPWRIGAELFGHNLHDMRKASDSPLKRLSLYTGVGFDPRWQPYPHQLVGTAVIWQALFGPRNSIINGDDMGIGKTAQTMHVFDLNLRAIWQRFHPSVIAPLFPRLDDGKLLGCEPKIGPTYVYAAANGLDVWVKTFCQFFGGNAMHNGLGEDWRPVLVIMHQEAKTLIRKYARHGVKIIDRIDDELRAELCAKPAWSTARPAYGSGAAMHEDRDMGEWEGAASWSPHKDATDDAPPPTSTRYLILTSRESTTSRFGTFVTGKDLDGPEGKAVKDRLKSCKPNATAKKAQCLKDLDDVANQLWIKRHKGHLGGVTDGRGLFQLTRRRQCRWGSNKTHRAIDMVVEMRRDAAMIVVDEFHNASGADTLTYSDCIGPFINPKHRGENWRPPGVMAITGTALHNGPMLAITFFRNVCMKVADKDSNDPGVAALNDVDVNSLASEWRKLFAAYKDPPSSSRTKAIDKLTRKSNLSEFFQCVLSYYYLARNYESRDPWGRPLQLLPVNLIETVEEIKHEPYEWGLIESAQQKVASQVRRHNERRLQAWRESGQKGPEPAPTPIAKADAEGYHRALIISCLPRIVQAIDTWINDHDGQYREHFGEASEMRLGGSNEWLTRKLSSGWEFYNSFLYDIAPEIVKGSAKVERLEAAIEQLRGDRTEAIVTPNNGSEPYKVGYQSKMIVSIGLRLVRAVVWAYLREKNRNEVAHIYDSVSRKEHLGRWQQYYDPDKDKVTDECFVLVAGTKCIAQSLNLVEGHVLCLFDPPGNNHDQEQVKRREYRIGQVRDCYVISLVTVNPRPPRDGHESLPTLESYILANNRGKLDFFATLREKTQADADALAREEEYGPPVIEIED